MSTDEFMEKISTDLISQTKQYSGAGVYTIGYYQTCLLIMHNDSGL